MTTTKCFKCGRAVSESDKDIVWSQGRLGHKNRGACNRAPRFVAPAAPVPQAAPVAKAQTVRAAYAAHYAATTTAGWCKRCGGPVSTGGSICDACYEG